jgi:cellulose synthase/poly-beta-1,6-N-acetylglucosamine synthase-like glycosyltransferase/DNA-binding response OmpR family regulator
MLERSIYPRMGDPASSNLPAVTPAPDDDARYLDHVLVVSPDRERGAELVDLVDRGGWLATAVGSAQEAAWELSPVLPHLVVIDVPDPDDSVWALGLIDRIRRHNGGESVPVVVVAPRESRFLTVAAFGRRADDVVSGSPHADELIARFRVRLERRPVPRDSLVRDPITGALTPSSFASQIDHELERLERGGRPGVLALLQLDELPELEARHGVRARDEIMAQVVALIQEDSRDVDFVGHVRGVLGILMPATPARGGQVRLDRLARLLSSRSLMVAGQVVKLTPIIGYASSAPGISLETLEERAWVAMMAQAEQLDLHPTAWMPVLSGESTRGSRIVRALGRARTPLQLATQQLACLVLPLGVYMGLDRIGLDITGVVYFILVIGLAMTAATIWAEGFAALRHTELPPEPADLPSASAIIAAYLPNEADTVVETVEAFLLQDHPDFQVILAYNTPTPLPVEEELHAIARRDPRFEPFRVEGSVSKAQNVNAALANVRGEVVGVFDADHHPDTGSFRRACRWLTNGAAVVQGHCVVRNGSTNFVTRLVATEFEAIYAVAHPGRARLHKFGIFGGSNGYWRTEVLKRKRMRGFMLTEDIDSSMRVVEAGGTIISDPGLISTELAPETAKALWNQRMRWAQGWSQVSLRHLRPMMRRPGAPLASRIGAFYLLAWREVYPWFSLQMFPLIAFWLLRGNPPINWFVPIFMATTLFTLSAGPAQVLFAYKLAHPSIKSHKRWFVIFLFSCLVFYTETKNIIVRTAHLKELMGERTWKVTPRASRPAPATVPGETERRSPASVGAPLRVDASAASAPHDTLAEGVDRLTA